ncbi:hypothetical protein N9L06_02650 [Mariniblastus sp.]|nr:hypothetical protein [Mariniblastus sp.]
MTFDELKESWKSQNAGALSIQQRETLVMQVCRRAERHASYIRFRDWRETIAALLTLGAFAFLTLFKIDDIVSSAMAWLGGVIVVIATLHILYRYHWARMIEGANDPDASVRDYCQTEVRRLDHQIWLEKNIVWWHLLPLLGGTAIWGIGMSGIDKSLPFYLGLLVATGIASHWWCQRNIRRKLLPLRKELLELSAENDVPV